MLDRSEKPPRVKFLFYNKLWIFFNLFNLLFILSLVILCTSTKYYQNVGQYPALNSNINNLEIFLNLKNQKILLIFWFSLLPYNLDLKFEHYIFYILIGYSILFFWNNYNNNRISGILWMLRIKCSVFSLSKKAFRVISE